MRDPNKPNNALQANKPQEAMSQLEGLKKAVLYIARHTRPTSRPELSKLADAIEELSFTIQVEDDDIPF